MEESNEVVITDIKLSFDTIVKLVANVMLANLLIVLAGAAIGFLVWAILGGF